MIETLQPLEPLGMAVVFSVLWFVRSKDGDVSTDDWDWMKFGSTFAVGLAVTVGMWAAGVDLSMVEFEARMATHAGTIVLVQGAIQSIVRNVRKRSREGGSDRTEPIE